LLSRDITQWERVETMRRDFVANVSHELKTPLTVLRGEIETLARPGADDAAVRRALCSADALVTLVEALLWFSRAQAPLERGALEIVNLADVVRQQAATVGQHHAGRALEVVGADELLVDGDERLLGRAIANLIDNALKYTAGGAPVVVTVTEREGRAVVEVQDHGPGVADGLRERIFEPFYRGSRERAETPGFGLGLPLCRAVARAHRGDVRVVDSTGGGSRFELTLPMSALA